MNCATRLSIFAAVLGLLGFVSSAGATAPGKPNIVFILADDLGWRDLDCYGSTYYQTPRIDALARRGLRFTQAYSASPLCSPTRSSILTGLFPARIGITVPGCHMPQVVLEQSVAEKAAPHQKSLQVNSVTRLKLEYFTLAESLKGAGYSTGHFGKWHLGAEPYDPLHQGFDVDVPKWSGPGPAGYIAPWRSKDFRLPAKPGEHVEDLMCNAAIEFIRANKDRPFFLNYWAFSVHAPYDAKADYLEQNRGRVDSKNSQRNPTMASMVQSLDDAVGRLVDTLDALKLTERTIIVFTSDNGGNMYDEVEGLPPTNNWPLRSGKGGFCEGGSRVPCIVMWPGLTRPGSVTDALLMSTDFFPTFCDILGIRAPPDTKFDGQSFGPLLRGQPHRRGPLFLHFPHEVERVDRYAASWVRDGDWKLIRLYCANEDQTDRFELYDLKHDLGEKSDLAEKNPAKVKELAAILERFLRETGAKRPKPNPTYDPTVVGQIAGWRAGHDGVWRRGPSGPVLHCTGGDPQIVTDIRPAVTGPFRVDLRVKSTGKGPATLYWSVGPPFARERSTTFPMEHDNKWHNYTAEVPAKNPVRSLRFDPGSAPGQVTIERIRAIDTSGKELRAWDFSK